MTQMGLVLYENAVRAVMQLQEVDEVIEHLGKAAAVQEYARRAKDRTLEVKAAEYRVYCETRLGEFSRESKRDGPGSPGNSQDLANCSRSEVAREAGIPESTLRAKHERLAEAGSEAVADAVQDVIADGDVPTAPKVLGKLGPMMTSNSDEWYTPEHVWRAALAALGVERFSVDPCSDPGMAIPADKHYTITDDGLTKPWRGIVWMNPPHSDIKRWVAYLRAEWESERCRDYAALVPARVDTAWWRTITDGAAGTVVFIKGRIKFGGAKNSAPFPSALVFGCTDPDEVVEATRDLGRAWRGMGE